MQFPPWELNVLNVGTRKFPFSFDNGNLLSYAPLQRVPEKGVNVKQKTGTEVEKRVDSRRLNIRSMPTYKESPFAGKLVVKTRPKRMTVARGSSLIDASTGEINGITEVAQVIPVDEEQFIKLYTGNLAAFFDLSRTGLRVFVELMKVAQTHVGTDLIYWNYEPEKPDEGMSKQTFYRGLQELLANEFVARHATPHWYFLNPTIFFNGDRVRFIREYHRKKRDANQADLFEGDTTKLLARVQAEAKEVK